MHDFVPLWKCSFFVPQSMPDASDNGACRPFEVHDFVPLLARMIKIVNQSRKTPLFTEKRRWRCIVLFRFLCPLAYVEVPINGTSQMFRFGMFLFCSDRCLDSLILKGEGALICSAFKVKPSQKRNLHDFVPLYSPLAYAEVPIDGTSQMFRFTPSYSLLYK